MIKKKKIQSLMELQEVSMTFQYLSCSSECPFNPERGTEKITEGSCTWESYNTSRESWMGQCQKKSSDNLQGSNVRLLRTPDKQTNKQTNVLLSLDDGYQQKHCNDAVCALCCVKHLGIFPGSYFKTVVQV